VFLVSLRKQATSMQALFWDDRHQLSGTIIGKELGIWVTLFPTTICAKTVPLISIGGGTY